jgi:hypothetical protein
VDALTLKPTTFRLETEIMDALAVIRHRDGIAVSEQVRRALKQWIAEQGVEMKEAIANSVKGNGLMVARARIELATLRFSVVCSTN